jgi:hypothetical protein
MRLPALIALACAALAGCGGSGSEKAASSGLTVLHTPSTTTAARPTGPLARICDRALAAEIRAALEANGVRPGLARHPRPSGGGLLSGCDLGPVVLRLDAASGAVKRYQNRIVETAQFSDSIPSRVPRPVEGVGDPGLGRDGANWIPFLHQLLSARGERVLITSVDAPAPNDAARLAAAKAISLIAWERL